MAHLLQNPYDERDRGLSKILEELQAEIESEEQCGNLPELRQKPPEKVLKNILDFSKSLKTLDFRDLKVPRTYSAN